MLSTVPMPASPPTSQTTCARHMALCPGAEGLCGAQERPTWHAAELAAAMRLAQDALRKRALFWIGHGVLEEMRAPTGTVSISAEPRSLMTPCPVVSGMVHLWNATAVHDASALCVRSWPSACRQ